MGMREQESDEIEDTLQWLKTRIEESRESYKRDTNDRHTAISLGKIRAYKDVRKEILERSADADTGGASE
jgi:hypothetical protein